jgi:para-aminobenzoate synthetase / 4-amino-4-deoxychorismate lyase
VSGPGARFDDLLTGRGLELAGWSGCLVTGCPAEVRPVLAAAGRAARQGLWVAGFVTYEAARGLNSALAVRDRQDGDRLAGLPLVWFGMFETARPAPPLAVPVPEPAVTWRWETDAQSHRGAVEDIRAGAARGDCYQVNHTVRLVADGCCEPVSLYAQLSAAQASPYACLVSTGEHAVVSASPELFFEWDGNGMVMRPMKGTASRGYWPAQDRRRRDALAASAKDRAENVMIVDLVRNDLGRIARLGTVAVEELFGIERYPTVWQMTSTVTARTLPEVELADVFAAVFPSGSVTGAPKRAAMDMIARLEDRPRGVYCGAVGLLAPSGAGRYTARFSVAIRTATLALATGRAEYGAGGGITWLSEPASEWAEVQAKAGILDVPPPPTQLIETTRSGPDGTVGLLDRHLARLAGSAEHLGFAVELDRVATLLATTAAANPDRVVRIAIDRRGRVDMAVLALPPPADGPLRVVVDDEPVDPDDPWLYHKTADRERYDRRRRRHPDADDVIMVNLAGQITESTIANVAVHLDGRWLTPPLRCGLVPGVAREHYLAAGRLKEEPITLEDLMQADDLALLNAVRGWQPAVLRGP